MKTRLSVTTVFALILLLQGCYPEGPEYVDELDIVYTNYDPSFDFKAANTFAIPDKVIEVDDHNFLNNNGSNETEFIDGQYASIILNEIRNNMVNFGWSEVNKDEDPDVIILTSVSSTTYVYYYYDWYYWNWWYPGWYDGWGWYYPGHYYPAYKNGHRSGSLFIQMTDSKNSGVNNNVPVRWSAVINGLMEGSRVAINHRLTKTINQAFRQSPYLQQ